MDIYKCPNGFVARATRFESLQCAIRACEGSRSQQKVLKSICSPCPNYINNRYQKDLEDLAKPIPKRA